MSLPTFTVVANYQAVITDSDDADADPDVQGISALVMFEPSVREVRSAYLDTVLVLRPITGRLEEDGILKTLDGQIGVPLIDNGSELGPLPSLTYTVRFSNVVFDKATRELTTFTFAAPGDGSTVDLATVPHV